MQDVQLNQQQFDLLMEALWAIHARVDGIEKVVVPVNTAQQAQPAIAELVKRLHAEFQPSHPFSRDDVIAWLTRQQQAVG